MMKMYGSSSGGPTLMQSHPIPPRTSFNLTRCGTSNNEGQDEDQIVPQMSQDLFIENSSDWKSKVEQRSSNQEGVTSSNLESKSSNQSTKSEEKGFYAEDSSNNPRDSYMNPNLKNDLSQMNISHITSNEDT